MVRKIFHYFLFVSLLYCFFPVSVWAQNETIDLGVLKQGAEEINYFSELIKQLKAEKKLVIGTEKRALGKQLSTTRAVYRNQIWQFVDDLGPVKTDPSLGHFPQFISTLLLEESTELKKEVEQGLSDTESLEKKIVIQKYDFGIGGQDKLAALKKKLKKKHKYQEILYSALVKNSKKLEEMGKSGDADVTYVKPLLVRQAGILSGQIGLERDKLLLLETKLRAVSNESSSGKKLLSDIRLQNIRIKSAAKRLQVMASTLETMDVDVSLFKKTVILTGGNYSSNLFDKRVLSQLYTEWLLKCKKILSKQAPEFIGKTISFLAVIGLAYLIALFVRKVVRKVFKRTFPEMSELAKSFIVSMSSKLVLLIGLLLALSNFGFQIGPVLAGLGIMGFIVGFALQDTLANFASGMMILIYRPFDVGDKIKSAGVKGKVSKMNLVSTTIFTAENHQLTVPNKKIWGDIIHNVTSQPLQRIDLSFSTPFNIDSEKVLAGIKEVVKTCSAVVTEKEISVRVSELGDSGVQYLARFWVATEDLYEAQWAISEGVKKRFDEEGISQVIAESDKS